MLKVSVPGAPSLSKTKYLGTEVPLMLDLLLRHTLLNYLLQSAELIYFLESKVSNFFFTPYGAWGKGKCDGDALSLRVNAVLI